MPPAAALPLLVHPWLCACVCSCVRARSVDFKYALEAHGVHLTDAELAGLQHELDVDGDGGVVYSVLLQALGLAEA